jgi:hypothetical protein
MWRLVPEFPISAFLEELRWHSRSPFVVPINGVVSMGRRNTQFEPNLQ